MSNKKVVVTGAEGMLGRTMHDVLREEGWEVSGFSRKRIDITCVLQLRMALKEIQPAYLINCAAYTAVDQAEEDPDQAYAINRLGVRNLAVACHDLGITLIHFSTDYVFDGKDNHPYAPTHATAPINVYGHSKLLGELEITKNTTAYYIFRTAWLYAPYGKNFLRWVTTTGQDRLVVVNNQLGHPTSAFSVAAFIAHVVQHDPQEYGTYHYADRDEMSWYDFACQINKKYHLNKEVVATDHFPTLAKRPTNSSLDCSLTDETFGYQRPGVDEGLRFEKNSS